MKMMESYATNLENIVEERTVQFNEQKQKVDLFLTEMLPRSVAAALNAGETVQAETCENVTIGFSGIVGFTQICSRSTAMETVETLNKFYSTLDNIINKFDAYKVTTVSDGYMVVSGLPNRNQGKHATVIAEISMSMLESVLDKFKTSHMADRGLQLKIGIHSGPVATGVVGLTMPKYCIFGDTVNVASRMERTAEAMKIQISWSTYHLLLDTQSYVLKPRGALDIKGKGLCNTYWLCGRQEPSIELTP